MLFKIKFSIINLKNSVKFILQDIINGNYCYIFFIFPVKINKIVICNFYGSGYGDNSKYLIEKITELKLEDKFNIFWLVDDIKSSRKDFPPFVKLVKYRSIKSLYHLSTAKIWIDNCRKIFYPPKRRSQHYIQTWHGSFMLKNIEKDAEKSLSKNYVRRAKKDSLMCDYVLSGSNFSTTIFRRAFWFNKEILEIGTPRCDILVQKPKHIIKKVFDFFNIKNESMVVMYAPTFKVNHEDNIPKISFEKILNCFEKKFNCEIYLLIRLHPNVAYLATKIPYNKKIINATSYPDMQELLLASSFLITDYSSSMLDMALTGNVCLLHFENNAKYLSENRSLYFTPDKLPFLYSENTYDLLDNIKNFEKSIYDEKVKNFFINIGNKETGESSIKLINLISKLTSSK